MLTRIAELGDAFRVTVVAPHDGRYGGAPAALLAGRLTPERLRWSPPPAVRVLRCRAVGCQPIHRRLWLADGQIVPYDRLSLNIGTRRLPAWAARPGTGQPRAWSGHSSMQLIGLGAALNADRRGSIVVAGGSRQALEIAGGLAARLASSYVARVTLLWPERREPRAVRTALRRLAWLGVDVVGGIASGLAPGRVRCVDGRRFQADHLVWAGPAEPDPLALAMRLPVRGPGLYVNRRLESPRAASIQVVGGAATLDGRRVLAGEDHERQASVLLSGVRAAAAPHAIKRYAPSWRATPIDLGPDAGGTPGLVAVGGWRQRGRRRAQRRWLGEPDE